VIKKRSTLLTLDCIKDAFEMFYHYLLLDPHYCYEQMYIQMWIHACPH